MNPLGNVFSHDVIHFLSRYFLDEDEVLYFNGNFKKIKFFLTFLCKVGDLDLLRSLHPKIDDSLIDIACRYGNLEIITWIQSRGGRVGRSSFQHAAESRNVNILEWLKKCNCPMNSSTLLLVVRQPNNLLVLEWFKKVECPMSLEIFVSAVQNKHSNVLSVLEWLRKNNCPWGEQVFAIAAQYANLNVLEWLLKNGCPWNHQTFSFAIQTGDLERLKWLKENGCLHLSDVYYWASQISSIPKRDKVLKWLIINQFPYHENTLYHSTTGDFNFVSFMYQHGFRFPREIIGYAAADVTNDLSVLQWILDHGGKISDHAITYAAKSGRIDVLEWLKEHNFPMNSVAYLYAIQNGHFETLKWLRKHNVQILYSHDLFGAAADLRKIPVLEWLKEEKCMFSETTLIRAAATRDITILEWFRLNGCKTNSRVNVSVWFQHLSLEIIEWFESHPEILNCY